MSHDTIVGYTYAADNECPRCIGQRFSWHGYTVDTATTEEILDLAARQAGVNRNDERSFDSGDFPKVITSSMVNDGRWEHCGTCGDCIDHDTNDCKGNPPLVCGYCNLPAVEAEIGYVHGDGTPDVGPITPGDYVTANHRPGTRIGAYDITEQE